MKDTQEILDLSEKGKGKNGEILSMDKRLFMQFLAFGDCNNVDSVINTLKDSSVQGVLYADINDPYGVGLLAMSESPDFFVDELRTLLHQPAFQELSQKLELSMLGRTYTIGHETDLQLMLLDKPRQKVLNPEYEWAIWYPLQRAKHFETISDQEQKMVLMEHGGIGMRFGKAGYATDIRLACHGMDKNDNDFVVGILGRELYPLSAVVQSMRKTKQTSQYLERLGPFFIGKAIWKTQL